MSHINCHELSGVSVSIGHIFFASFFQPKLKFISNQIYRQLKQKITTRTTNHINIIVVVVVIIFIK